ncbi:MAG: MFS transporter [Cyanobacteria bacterium P01_F01_bin.150]
MKLISFHRTDPQLNWPWLLYALGFMGLFLINGALASVIIYRYDPGPNTEQLPILVPTVVVGMAYCFGRIAGAILQPVAGYFSDLTEGRWGKRRPFLAASTLPLVMSFVLLFNPLVTETSEGNNVYLIGLLCLFYLASALYQVPFLAWLSELAPLPQQRVMLSSWLAIGSLVGAVFGAAATPWIIGRYGFETMTLLVATISLGTLLLPLLNDERPTETSLQKRRLPLLRTLKMGWQNPTFRAYVLGISSAWVTMAILAACPTFVAIALLHRGVGFSALINALVFGGALLMQQEVTSGIAWCGRCAHSCASFLEVKSILKGKDIMVDNNCHCVYYCLHVKVM